MLAPRARRRVLSLGLPRTEGLKHHAEIWSVLVEVSKDGSRFEFARGAGGAPAAWRGLFTGLISRGKNHGTNTYYKSLEDLTCAVLYIKNGRDGARGSRVSGATRALC